MTLACGPGQGHGGRRLQGCIKKNLCPDPRGIRAGRVLGQLPSCPTQGGTWKSRCGRWGWERCNFSPVRLSCLTDHFYTSVPAMASICAYAWGPWNVVEDLFLMLPVSNFFSGFKQVYLHIKMKVIFLLEENYWKHCCLVWSLLDVSASNNA